MKKGIIIAIIAVVIVFVIQWLRYWSKTSKLIQGEGVVLGPSYFPFQGSYTRENTIGLRSSQKPKVVSIMLCACPDGTIGSKPNQGGNCDCSSATRIKITGWYNSRCYCNGVPQGSMSSAACAATCRDATKRNT